MTRRKKTLKKGLNLTVCLLLLVSMMPFARSSSVAATELADTRVADPSTLDGWKDIFSLENPTTEYAGAIWTDKSVLTDDEVFSGAVKMQNEESNFLVALSAIASDQSITGYSQVPTDTIFVLDVSRSMGADVQPGDKNNNAVDELIKATNEAITQLMSANNNNRVGVVLYSGTYSTDVAADATNAMVLLPLGRYEHEDNAFLIKDNHIFTVGTLMRTAESIKVNASVTSSGEVVEQKEREIFGGTFTQGGVYAAMMEFMGVEDTEVHSQQFQSGTKRLPVMVLMSDGVATSASTNYMGEDGSIGTSDMGNGNTPEDELATAVPFATQLTCAYAKEKISEHYGRESLFYTLGYNVKSTPVLDPANTSTDAHWETYNATKAGDYMQLAVKSTWISNGWWGEGHWDEEYKTIRKSEYDLDKNYADKYFYTDDDLSGAFREITDEIMNKSLYYPTQVSSGNIHHDGYVEFIDDIGQFMEVKKVHGILLGDTLFTGDNIASNFIAGGGGNLGTIDRPSTLGNEMIRSVKARLGITETARAQELVREAFMAKQLYCDPATGDWSNYIGWYADADGNYLGHGAREDKEPLAGAVFYNESYGYLGEVVDGHKQSDMMYVSVQVHTRIETGTSAVIFRVPASLVPVINYNVTMTGESMEAPGEITLTVNDTSKKDADNDGDVDETVHASPIRLVFEVGLKDGINELNVSQTVGESYKYSEDGTYDFYVSRWNADAINHEHPSTAENTVSFFEPSEENGRYYYNENTTVYKKAGDEYVPYTGAVSPAEAEEPLYREYGVFEVINDNIENNARLHKHYEQISAEALSVAKADADALGADTRWYIPKGTIHRMYRDLHLGKGGFADDEKLQVNSNNTETVKYSHYIAIELTTDETGESAYYADVVHGNNGKISIKQAQGIALSAEADITLASRKDAFKLELSSELADTQILRLVKTDALGNSYVSEVSFENGRLSVEVAEGECAYLLDVPAGTDITVSEKGQGSDYRIKSVNGEELSQVTLNVQPYDITKAHFVNTMLPPAEDAALVLYNTVEHPFEEDYDIPENIVFDYTVLYTDDQGQEHTEEVTLAPFESKHITGIPVGAEVTVTETGLNKGFSADAENNTKTFLAEVNENYIVEFKNTYAPEPVNPMITVTGDKTLEGRAQGKWLDSDVFTFKLQKLSGAEWTDMPEGVAVADNNNQSFDLSDAIQAECYSEAGTYSYRVIEVYDENPCQGMDYDKSVRWFDVIVTDKDMDGQLEIDRVVPYTGTTADKSEESGEWNIKTSFTNIYAAVGSDSVRVLVKNKVICEDTLKENASISKAGYEFGLYQNGRLVTILPATTDAGESLISLNYGTLDIGKHIHYELKLIPPLEVDSDMKYSTQVYNIAVEVQDDAQGGVKAVLTVSESGGESFVTGDEVVVEFTNLCKAVGDSPTNAPVVIPTDPVPTIPEPSDGIDSSSDEADKNTRPDVPQTGFVESLDGLAWWLFAIVLAVGVAGLIFTSKRK